MTAVVAAAETVAATDEVTLAIDARHVIVPTGVLPLMMATRPCNMSGD